jgi:glc operon protein GlcG
MRTKPCLTLDDANRAIAAAKAEAAKNQWAVTIAVVDDAGFLLHLERLDGASVATPEVATLKARTAAVSRAPTKRAEEMVKERPSILSLPGRVPVQGGLPIFHQGECVGAIGVSGAKSDQDEQVAQAGLAGI